MRETIHLKTILKKILWIIGAILSSFIIDILIYGIFELIKPNEKMIWINFVLFVLITILGLLIMFIIYKKIIVKKAGEKIGKVFLIMFFFLFFILLVRHFLIQPFIIRGEGLKPYLNNNDYCLTEIFNKSIKKGDIVIIKKEDNFIDSLAIGLPGDKIELKDGVFFINGEPLKNISYNFYHVYGVDSNTGNYFIIVPPDSFFGIRTLLDEKFSDNEQTIQKQLTASNSICPDNSYLNPKDNLCYCDEGFIWNKNEGKDAKCVKGIDLSIDLYKQSDIVGKVIHCFHIGK